MNASTLSDIDLFPDEDINEFMSGRLRLIQSRKGYRFSIDAILLAEFATTKKGDILIDLGKNILKKLGYRVEILPQPVEALEIFKAQPDKFDLVISDMTMPNMTGDTLAMELMKIRPDLPVIICTGYSERMDDQRAQELGIKGLIMKPFTIRSLSKTVRNALDGKG